MFCCAESSGDGNVSLWKIVAFEQEGHVELIGARIGKAIAHIERRRVPPSSIPFERRDSPAPDFSGDRHNPHCGLLKEAVEDRLCFRQPPNRRVGCGVLDMECHVYRRLQLDEYTDLSRTWMSRELSTPIGSHARRAPGWPAFRYG